MAQVYVDMAEHLKSLLDVLEPNNKYKVSNERNLDGVFNNDIVVSALSGTTTKNSATIPYQIDIISNDPDKIINLFTKLAKDYNMTTFRVISEGRFCDIYQTYNTPVIMDKDIEYGDNHEVRVVVFANLYIMFNVSNIKKLTIDNEEIETLSGSLNYLAESSSNRISGQNLNKNKKKASTLTLTFRMITRDSVFGRKVFKVATGQLDGNTSFSIKIEKTNGDVSNLVMFINAVNDAWQQNALPSVEISMLPYDNRTNQ